MASPNDKILKPYRRPLVTQVKLEMEEAVLQACKANNSDRSGKGNKVCGHPGCKKTLGS
jgi:hypothetical protein